MRDVRTLRNLQILVALLERRRKHIQILEGCRSRLIQHLQHVRQLVLRLLLLLLLRRSGPTRACPTWVRALTRALPRGPLVRSGTRRRTGTATQLGVGGARRTRTGLAVVVALRRRLCLPEVPRG